MSEITTHQYLNTNKFPKKKIQLLLKEKCGLTLRNIVKIFGSAEHTSLTNS